jgi:hypothetical protein
VPGGASAGKAISAYRLKLKAVLDKDERDVTVPRSNGGFFETASMNL